MKNKSHTIDPNTIKQNITKYSSQKLCEMIACARYFKMDNSLLSICMEELSKRRVAGDSLLFEDIITKCYNELPPLHLEAPDLRTVLKGIVK